MRGKVGRPPIPVPRMLRMCFLQQWTALADEASEDALHAIQAMREFAGIDLAHGNAGCHGPGTREALSKTQGDAGAPSSNTRSTSP